MVSLMSLGVPILLSAVVVFIASSVIHMFLKYHNTNLSKLDAEDAVRDALRPFNIPPGDYSMPHMQHEDMKDPAYREKFESGPVALITVLPNKVPGMGKSLGLWFAYCLLVSLFAAYLAGRTLMPGTEYMEVFRVAGTVAFAGYALALLHDSIWFARKWSTTAKFMFDGLIYALLTAGVFGWLWPAAA